MVTLLLPPGLERDKFDNKTVSFEEHIKLEHNMWNYLYFIVLVRVKNKTDYTGPESYVAQMIKVRTHTSHLGGHTASAGLGLRVDGCGCLSGQPRSEEQLGPALGCAKPCWPPLLDPLFCYEGKANLQ